MTSHARAYWRTQQELLVEQKLSEMKERIGLPPDQRCLLHLTNDNHLLGFTLVNYPQDHHVVWRHGIDGELHCTCKRNRIKGKTCTHINSFQDATKPKE